MKNYKITIPKPCHEDWNKMTPKDKGRFCSSCAKTVVDFTQKSNEEIQEFFQKNKNEKVCGHFYRKQLDSVVIQIPEAVFSQKLSYQKMFLLLLLIVMGTTLFSCKTDTNTNQKIDKVEVIDSIIKPVVKQEIDSTSKINEGKTCNDKISPPPIPALGGILVTKGEPVVQPKDTIEEVLIEGDIDFTEVGEAYVEKIKEPIPFILVSNPPRFKETKNSSSKEILLKEFNKKMNDYIVEKFDQGIINSLNLKQGEHRMYGQFKIDKKGYVFDVKIRAPHKVLKNHLEEIINQLPQFIPAQRDGKKASVYYTLPVNFVVE